MSDLRAEETANEILRRLAITSTRMDRTIVATILLAFADEVRKAERDSWITIVRDLQEMLSNSQSGFIPGCGEDLRWAANRAELCAEAILRLSDEPIQAHSKSTSDQP